MSQQQRSPKLALTLYRALLREARRVLPPSAEPPAVLTLHEPLGTNAAGSYSTQAPPFGLAHQTAVLEALVPGLEWVPHERPITLATLRQAIRENFRLNSGAPLDVAAGFSAIDQGFAALRHLPQQAYLHACSSVCQTDGVVIEATSCFSHSEPSINLADHWFNYRIRITNNRPQPIRVLGRGWVVSNHIGELQGFVKLTPDNGVVGQRPVIPAGQCFSYQSRTPIRSSEESGKVVGSMQGHLMVELIGEASGSAPLAADAGSSDDDSSGRGEAAAGVQRVAMPVAQFALRFP